MKRVDPLTVDDRERLAEYARAFIEFVAALDPAWAKRIESARAERGWTDLQMVTAWVARTLENEAHMTAPPHPFFQPAFRPSTGKCAGCGKRFKPEFAGQQYHEACYEQAQTPIALRTELAAPVEG